MVQASPRVRCRPLPRVNAGMTVKTLRQLSVFFSRGSFRLFPRERKFPRRTQTEHTRSSFERDSPPPPPVPPLLRSVSQSCLDRLIPFTARHGARESVPPHHPCPALPCLERLCVGRGAEQLPWSSGGPLSHCASTVRSRTAPTAQLHRLKVSKKRGKRAVQVTEDKNKYCEY